MPRQDSRKDAKAQSNCQGLGAFARDSVAAGTPDGYPADSGFTAESNNHLKQARCGCGVYQLPVIYRTRVIMVLSGLDARAKVARSNGARTAVLPWLHLLCLERNDGIKIESVSFRQKGLADK